MYRNFDDVLRMMTGAIGAWAPGSTAVTGERGDRSDYGDLMDFMTQVYLACMNSSFHYWSRWAEIYASYYPIIMQNLLMMNSDPNNRGEAGGTLTDSLRAYLREMTELPFQESQRLQVELEKIAGKVWPAAEGEQEGPYWRRWGVKQ